MNQFTPRVARNFGLKEPYFIKIGLKGCVEFTTEVIFEKYSKMKMLLLIFLKMSNFGAFFRPSTLKNESFKKNLRVDNEYKEKSFDNFFNMGYRGEEVQSPIVYG